MIRCAETGVACPAGVKHTITKTLTLLYKCCACQGNKQCWYADPDDIGKVCVLRPEVPDPKPLCK
jgi:hypothetical protein